MLNFPFVFFSSFALTQTNLSFFFFTFVFFLNNPYGIAAAHQFNVYLFVRHWPTDLCVCMCVCIRPNVGQFWIQFYKAIDQWTSKSISLARHLMQNEILFFFRWVAAACNKTFSSHVSNLSVQPFFFPYFLSFLLQNDLKYVFFILNFSLSLSLRLYVIFICFFSLFRLYANIKYPII